MNRESAPHFLADAPLRNHLRSGKCGALEGKSKLAPIRKTSTRPGWTQQACSGAADAAPSPRTEKVRRISRQMLPLETTSAPENAAQLREKAS